MGLLSSLFSRSPSGDVAEADGPDNLAQLRTRARQRLIGAVVLVGIGVVAFPLLFETQPRPIALDVPIEIPRKDSAPPLSVAASRAPAAKASAAPVEAEPPAAKVAAAPPIITETAAEAGLVPARPAAGGSRPSAMETKPEPKPVPRPEPEPSPATAAAPNDAARAQALLDGNAAASAPAASTRYIVQIGAFADPELAQRTRWKVERLGLVTYTHVAKTPDGDRTRVRVGPVSTREEAEKMAAKIKAAGLSAAILTL